MIKKYYELSKWDVAIHNGQKHIFQKMDWAYAKWIDEDWNSKTWSYMEYEKKEDWFFYPIIK